MKQNTKKENPVSFWEHLDVFRNVLFRCLIGWGICSLLCFFFKDFLFGIIFAPAQSDFILYRLLCRLSDIVHWKLLCPDAFDVSFINIDLVAQFTTHLQVSVWGGLVVVSPYVIYELYGFVAPALYENEKKYASKAIIYGLGLFFIGVSLNFFLIFPLSFRFLFTYQVHQDVINQISLSSYISTFLVLSLLLGLVFEIPILGWLLGRIGVIDSNMLRRYRRHALVCVLIIAAIITPTADAFTLLLVTIPIYLLYEVTIMVVKRI